MKRRLAIVSVLFGLIQTAYAEEEFQPYVGGALGLGVFSMTVNGAQGSGNSLIGYGSIGFIYKGAAGAELRVGGTDSAAIAAGGININARTDWFISYLARFQSSISDQFDIYTLFGGTTSKKSFHITTPGWFFLETGTPSMSRQRTTASLGFGFDYQSTDDLNVGAELMLYGDSLSAITGNFRYLF